MEADQGEKSIHDIQEYKALTSVLNSYLNYKSWALKEIVNPKKLKYESLADDEKKLLSWFPDYLGQLEHSAVLNGQFLEIVANTMGPAWGAGDPQTWFRETSSDLNHLLGLMSQYVREWSSDGKEERDISFGRILKAAEKYFPDVDSRPNVEVLVPGAGLGRLLVEFVRRGFRTQGNEISYHMLLNSNFILNNTYCENNFVLCPFIHKSSNVDKRNYQCRQVYFPDFNPSEISEIRNEYPLIPVEDLMSMVAGGFTDLYGPLNKNKISDLVTDDPIAMEFRKENKDKFKIIATCYFLDTATNIIDYLKTIRHCLHDDGFWINFGPLLWHFENDDNVYNVKTKDPEGNIKEVPTPLKGLELSREDIIDLVKSLGFEFVEHESGIESSYGCDSRSLGNWKYKCEYWVCRKKKVI